MQLDDLEQVMKIENENFSRPWTETGFFTFLIRQDTLFLIAAEGEEILGYCGVVMVQDEGDITNVSVKKDRQNHGTGKLLVQELIRITNEMECPVFFWKSARAMKGQFMYMKKPDS